MTDKSKSAKPESEKAEAKSTRATADKTPTAGETDPNPPNLPAGFTNPAPRPAGPALPHGTALPRGGIAPDREPDHMGVAQKREDAKKRAEHYKKARKERREKIRAGDLPGEWFAVGTRLVNGNTLTAIDLPTEGDENPAVTFYTMGGPVTAVGDDAREVMDELGLKPVPRFPTDPDSATIQESGRLLTPADVDAAHTPGHMDSVPTGMHRANASGPVGGETEDDVKKRAGDVAIPPVGPAALATEPRRGDEGGSTGPGPGGPSDPIPDDEEEVDEEDPKTGKKTGKKIRQKKKKK